MIELKIENETFDLAEEWSEITFAQYLDMANITQDKQMDETTKAVKVIAHLSDNPEKCEQYLMEMDKSDFEELVPHFLWTNSKIQESSEPKEFLLIEGKKYKIKKQYNKITMGEMATIETLINNQKNLNPYEVVFGVLLREVDENGVEKKFNEDDFYYILTKLKSKVMLLDVYSHIDFFLAGRNQSSNNTKGFSVQKKAKKTSSEV